MEKRYREMSAGHFRDVDKTAKLYERTKILHPRLNIYLEPLTVTQTSPPMILSGRNGQFHRGNLNPSGKLCRDFLLWYVRGRDPIRHNGMRVGDLDIIVGDGRISYQCRAGIN